MKQKKVKPIMAHERKENYGEWELITGRDAATANGKRPGSIDPITGKIYVFYGEARKEVSSDHWIFRNLYLKIGKVKEILRLETVYVLNPSYTSVGKEYTRKAYLSVGYRIDDDKELNDLAKLDDFLSGHIPSWW
jgi:hypothetical protein